MVIKCINDFENGKKYPKPDKIAILSDKLDVPYDQMVSLKLDKNLAPIGDILQSKILKEIHSNLILDLEEINHDVTYMNDINKACSDIKNY